MKAKTESKIVIRSVAMETVTLNIVGTAPLLQHRMRQEVIDQLIENAKGGKAAKVAAKAKASDCRDLEAEFNEAMHITADGRCGHPASAFRNALIRASQGFNLVMSEMKSVFFIEADALSVNGNPLVLIKGVPVQRLDVIPGNKAGGAAVVISRPMFPEWRMRVRITFPTNRIDAESVANIFQAAGQTVGIGPGRPQSTNSNGIGMGTWTIEATKGK